MSYLFSFEKLDVYQLSREFVKNIYKLTKDFPGDEKYGITSQIRRAAVSIPNNLAEGSGRISGKDKATFTSYSYSSLMEVLNLLMLATDLTLLKEEKYIQIRPKIYEISNKLNSLRKSQLRNN
jgi:four helix bundle protein